MINCLLVDSEIKNIGVRQRGQENLDAGGWHQIFFSLIWNICKYEEHYLGYDGRLFQYFDGIEMTNCLQVNSEI